jgi:ADP-ribose pyrophosphatase
MEQCEAFRYCAQCGSPRAPGLAGNPFRCDACGFVHYFTPVLAVAAIIRDADGRVLLITRGREPGKGMLGMPGGFVDPGETAEEAVRREVREEVGLEIAGLVYFASYPNRYHWNGITIAVTDLFFTAQAPSLDPLRPEEGEVDAIHFEPLPGLDLGRVAFASMRRALEDLRKVPHQPD